MIRIRGIIPKYGAKNCHCKDCHCNSHFTKPWVTIMVRPRPGPQISTLAQDIRGLHQVRPFQGGQGEWQRSVTLFFFYGNHWANFFTLWKNWPNFDSFTLSISHYPFWPLSNVGDRLMTFCRQWLTSTFTPRQEEPEGQIRMVDWWNGQLGLLIVGLVSGNFRVNPRAFAHLFTSNYKNMDDPCNFSCILNYEPGILIPTPY